jgi:hypothetical protein
MRAAIQEDFSPDVASAFEYLDDALVSGNLYELHREHRGVKARSTRRDAEALRIFLGHCHFIAVLL